MSNPLAGRVALVTGVSRRPGIGFAIARRLLADGASVLIHSFSEHDAQQPWGADPGGMSAVIEELGGVGQRLQHIDVDLGNPDAPGHVVAHAVKTFGALDILVVNHAHSSDQSLETVTPGELDRAWAVNARAAVLLAQAFSERHDDARPGGRVVLLTSGQHLAPMPKELPYAISKGAVHQATRTLADALADRGITVNAINPGPVDTGWPSAELRERLRPAFPGGRWGRPEDIAAIVGWIVSEDSAWMTGQVINAEGGFRRQSVG
ncbi:MAG: SDR family oxidoreductase [Solirubrobacterales bacterium]|nr:SDR family oxidoreductase [Solirubrobacterales bacterium]